MWWLRKSTDISQATIRLSTEADITRVSRLLRDGSRRYYGLTPADLPALLANANGVLLETPPELQGVAVVGRSFGNTTWLRGVALARATDVTAGIRSLLPPLHSVLRARGMRAVYYAGDETSDSWLLPALKQHRYVHDTEVVVYEKHQMDIPWRGNPAVFIRPVQQADQANINTLDHLCFEVQWIKDYEVLCSAIAHGTLFFVAELESQVVGYAYATSHFHGRLFHLVRIAVDPQMQGHGIGVRLLAEIIDAARRQHAHLVTLNTQAYNVRAQRLYTWFGFIPTGERQDVLRYDL